MPNANSAVASPQDAARDLPRLARRARARLLAMHFKAGVGHIGGNLSALDALLCLHHAALGADDAFILSKGHAAGALYASLWSCGQLTDAQLDTFHADGTRLAAHPAGGWHEAIPFSTGSLGHGLGLASGLAFGRRLRRQPGRVYCLMSDGECEEGSVWEALMFAGHHRLSNLTVLVDRNGLQGFGATGEVASLEPIPDKLVGFGFDVEEVDGHDFAAMTAAFSRSSDRPRMILLRTVKGRGVSFMEGRMEWHYLPLSPEQFALALAEVDAR